MLVFGQAVLVGAHQERLADRGARLELAQVGGASAEAEPAHAGADGPGADQGDLAAGGAQPVQLVGQGLHAGRLQGAVGPGQHVGADLDDDGVGQGDDFLANRVDHAFLIAWERRPRFFYGSARRGGGRIRFHETGRRGVKKGKSTKRTLRTARDG